MAGIAVLIPWLVVALYLVVQETMFPILTHEEEEEWSRLRSC